ncbi:DotU family type IV/VI secretion system protein [Cloacibacillus sp.]
MKNLCERFTPLMAETLRCAGVPEEFGTPLADVNDRLVRLADQERVMAAGCGPDLSGTMRRELEAARFAVTAWADEQMLSSPRPDAALWSAMSLQFHYFATSEAGRLFYQELGKCLDTYGVPRRVRVQPSDAESRGGEDEENLLLEAEARTEQESWRILDLAERIDRAAAVRTDEDKEEAEALCVFALCLLYGFRGALYNDPALLGRVRKSCRALFDRFPAAPIPPARRRPKNVLAAVERVSFVALPVLICILFALYCGGVLANVPFHGGL